MEQKHAQSLQSQGLEALKSYYNNYVNLYSATQPGWIKSIRYFIDWLETAPVSAVSKAEQYEFSIRQINYYAHLEGFKTSGSVEYTRSCNAEYSGFIVNSHKISEFITNFHFSSSADSQVVPAELSKICMEEGRGVFKSNFPDFVYYSEKTRLISYNITSPEKQSFIDCVLIYPFKDKQLELPFIVYNGQCYIDKKEPKRTGGCYVATCVYGSYDCAEVWTLRRYRDFSLNNTRRGRLFIRAYYKISPAIVRLFGEKPWFKKVCKKYLDKKIARLHRQGIESTPYDDLY